MKKINSIIVSSLVIAFVLVYACKKKETNVCSDNSGVKPGYKTECTGTGGNPNAGNATHTGSVPITNPASKNTIIDNIGTTGWLNPSCASSNSLIIKGLNGSTEVTLQFSTPPLSGNYNVSNVSGPTNVMFTILNAPEQPSGIMWYGKGGTVAVSTTTNGINASFSGIQCVQSNFNFPVVTASGVVGCN